MAAIETAVSGTAMRRSFCVAATGANYCQFQCFRSSGKRARCNQVRTVHCPDVLFWPCSKGTLWTAIFCRNDKCLWFRSTETSGCPTGQVHSGFRRLFPSARTLNSAFLFSSSSTCIPYLPWSWGEQSNMCFEVPMKRDLVALVRAQEETLDSIRCN